MKWLRTLILFDRGDVAASEDWRAIHDSYVRSIQSIDHPKGSGTLTLRRKVKLKDGQSNRNGVKYLKHRFLEHLVSVEGWKPESGFDLDKGSTAPTLRLYPNLVAHSEPITSTFGKFDFVTTAPNGTHVAIEWETGNISSSHRSLNKLVIALNSGKIQVGVLIVPSRNLYEHLTDRIGNIGELSPYLSFWNSIGIGVKHGLLVISIVEHHALTVNKKIPYLGTGKDGRAREGQSKRR